VAAMEGIPRYEKNEMKKPKKGKRQQQIGKTPSTAACRIPVCAIFQLAQLKSLSPLLTLKIDLNKTSLPHINEDP
jgi:hypothetical protein